MHNGSKKPISYFCDPVCVFAGQTDPEIEQLRQEVKELCYKPTCKLKNLYRNKEWNFCNTPSYSAYKTRVN